jgi:hypothetical protein
MSKVFSFFNEEKLKSLQDKDFKRLKSLTVLQNKSIVLYFTDTGELTLTNPFASAATVADKEVEDLFSPKPVERCVSTTIDQEGLLNVSPQFGDDNSGKNEENNTKKVDILSEDLFSYVTPDRKTKPHLVNVSPKRICKRSKVGNEEKKDDDFF